jgi:hypothetical protein
MSFPLSPTNNQIATLNGINYQYNSATTSWTRVAAQATTFGNLTIGGNVTIGTGNTQVSGIVISNVGNLYTSSPTVTISGGGGSGAAALANANIGVFNIGAFYGGTGYSINDTLTAVGNVTFLYSNVIANATFTVTSVASGAITGLVVRTPGVYLIANANPITFTGGTGTNANANVYYGVLAPTMTYNGVSYAQLPTVTITGGGGSGAAAYAVFGGNTLVATMGNLLSFYSPAGEAMRMGIAGNLQLFSNASSNVSNAGQALLVPGGAGIAGNLYVGNRVGYTYANSASAVYSFYNAATNSYDITFGG